MLNFGHLDILHVLYALLAAYVLGSIPSAVWVGKIFFNTDVRTQGSKNAGATNTFRILGKKAGITVLILDVAKGLAAVLVLPFFYNAEELTSSLTFLQIISGLMAVVGHVFPVFAQFKGGKGVATSLGMVLAIHPSAALCSVGIFLLVFIPTGYVSLGSMTAALSFPVFILSRLFGQPDTILVIFGFCMSVFEIYTHRANIKRLVAGNENRIFVLRRRSA
jgi:acyl phosphate:glycerol-3-phosphate acyltransferase